MKVKWTVKQIKQDKSDLSLDQHMYTKKIIPFMIKVTKENILDILKKEDVLTDKIQSLIENY